MQAALWAQGKQWFVVAEEPGEEAVVEVDEHFGDMTVLVGAVGLMAVALEAVIAVGAVAAVFDVARAHAVGDLLARVAVQRQ
jgi:hypothetical protein